MSQNINITEEAKAIAEELEVIEQGKALLSRIQMFFNNARIGIDDGLRLVDSFLKLTLQGGASYQLDEEPVGVEEISEDDFQLLKDYMKPLVELLSSEGHSIINNIFSDADNAFTEQNLSENELVRSAFLSVLFGTESELLMDSGDEVNGTDAVVACLAIASAYSHNSLFSNTQIH